MVPEVWIAAHIDKPHEARWLHETIKSGLSLGYKVMLSVYTTINIGESLGLVSNSFYVHPKKLTQLEHIRVLLKKSTSPKDTYIIFCDHDDILLNAHKTNLDVLMKGDGAGFVAQQYIAVNPTTGSELPNNLDVSLASVYEFTASHSCLIDEDYSGSVLKLSHLRYFLHNVRINDASNFDLELLKFIKMVSPLRVQEPVAFHRIKTYDSAWELDEENEELEEQLLQLALVPSGPQRETR